MYKYNVKISWIEQYNLKDLEVELFHKVLKPNCYYWSFNDPRNNSVIGLLDSIAVQDENGYPRIEYIHNGRCLLLYVETENKMNESIFYEVCADYIVEIEDVSEDELERQKQDKIRMMENTIENLSKELIDLTGVKDDVVELIRLRRENECLKELPYTVELNRDTGDLDSGRVIRQLKEEIVKREMED